LDNPDRIIQLRKNTLDNQRQLNILPADHRFPVLRQAPGMTTVHASEFAASSFGTCFKGARLESRAVIAEKNQLGVTVLLKNSALSTSTPQQLKPVFIWSD